MQRVLIMGGPGFGKWTMAQQLAAVAGLPVYHLDRFFWKPGWVQSTWDEFAEHVRTIVERDQWVIDGNYSRTLPERLNRADTLVFLDLPLRVRLPRVLKRRIQYHGQTRYDLGEDCPERIDWVFLKQVIGYQRGGRVRALNLLEELQQTDIRLFHLCSESEVRSFQEMLRVRVSRSHEELVR